MLRSAALLVLRAAEAAGLNHALAAALLRPPRLLVLCYHGVLGEDVGDASLYNMCVPEGEFAAHLETLARRFHPISPADLLDCLEGRARLKPRSVLVTFDDGYRNNFTRAAPLLGRYGVPALFSITTGHIGGRRLLWTREMLFRLSRWPAPPFPLPPGFHGQPRPEAVVAACKRLPDTARRAYLETLRAEPLDLEAEAAAEAHAFLSWDEVRALAGMGFEIASHTVTHPILSRVDAPTLETELRASKAALERETGRPCRFLVYPNGGLADVSPAVFSAAAAAGYQAAFTLTDRPASLTASPFSLTRMTVLGFRPLHIFHRHAGGILLFRNSLRR